MGWPFGGDENSPSITGTTVMTPSPHEIDRDYGDEALSSQDTRGRHFTKRKFVKTNIDSSAGGAFINCEFRDCTWVGGSVNGVLFTNCRHIRSDFSDTQLARVEFVGAR
jgi:hypothetical protein